MLDESLREFKECALRRLGMSLGKFFSAMQVTILGFICGLISVAFVASGNLLAGQGFWWLNRLFDGLDGIIARQNKQQSDFGGYVDILCDFSIYSLLPIALVWSHHKEQIAAWLLLALLQGTYFVNCASLFFLAAVIEKKSLRNRSSASMTTLEMPRAMIEGAETMVFYGLFLTFPEQALIIFALFGIGVTVNIFQRLFWAANNI